MPRQALQLTLLATLLYAAAAHASWPQFLGPGRDAAAPDAAPPIRPNLQPEHLIPSWRAPVGSGYAGPVADATHAYLFHRVEDELRLSQFDLATGAPGWEFSHPSTYRDDFGFDDGPRAAPTIHADRIILFSPEGLLLAVDSGSGELVWSVDTAADLSSEKGFFGRAASPLVIDDKVLLNIGGRTPDGTPASVAAFTLADGELVWAAADHGAGYGSSLLIPAAAPDAPPIAVFFTRQGLLGLRPADGTTAFDIFFRSTMDASVNGATPLWCPGHGLFATASYGVGAALWKDPANSPDPAWQTGDVLDAHYATPVYYDGHIYGFHGRQERGQELRCLRLSDGSLAWSSERLGASTLVRVHDQLLALSEDGELIIAKASPDACQIAIRQPIFRGGHRSHAAYSEGWYLARDDRQLICIPLGSRSPTATPR